MKMLIDADLPSNNGGWQWSASTGTDPQPYFRIFNPVSQSEKVCILLLPKNCAWYLNVVKADPTGEYIRHYVPELAKLKGKGV